MSKQNTRLEIATRDELGLPVYRGLDLGSSGTPARRLRRQEDRNMAMVRSYETGALLYGSPSEDLLAASGEAAPEGAVAAYLDAGGVWQYVREDAISYHREVMGHDVRIVYVEEPWPAT